MSGRNFHRGNTDEYSLAIENRSIYPYSLTKGREIAQSLTGPDQCNEHVTRRNTASLLSLQNRTAKQPNSTQVSHDDDNGPIRPSCSSLICAYYAHHLLK